MDAGDWGRARAPLPRGVLAAVWAALVVASLVLIGGVRPDDVEVAASAPVAAVVRTVPATAPSTTSTWSPVVVVPVAVCGDDGACGVVAVASTDP